MRLKTVIQKLNEANRRIHSLDTIGRWNRLARMLLTRITNKQENRTLKRWHKLILIASRRDKLNLK